MFFIYILQSKKDKSIYIGYSNDLRKRLKEHNLGFVRSTKSKIPFNLVYYEAYASKQDALNREHNLKLRAPTPEVLNSEMRAIKIYNKIIKPNSKLYTGVLKLWCGGEPKP